MSRNVELACGHDEALATLHRDELTAWCPICVADVQVADEGGGGPVPRLEGDNIVKSWRYRGPGGGRA